MEYEDKLLQGWEEIYKRGQLTLWVLLALRHGSKNMDEVRAWLDQSTDGAITAEERSLYRVLQRFHTIELVTFTHRSGKRGPNQKVYQLSPLGERLLQRFIERNLKVFDKPDIRKLL